MEAVIRELLRTRPASGSICPSEAARVVAASASRSETDRPTPDWRDLMEPARRAARRLAALGEVQITQAGRVVDPSDVKGPIRIRLMR